MTTEKIDPQLRQTMQAQPNAEFLLLLRVDQIDANSEQALAAHSVAIRRSLTLVPTFAVTCTGAAALHIAEYSWVRCIEADRPVYAMTPYSTP